MNDEFHHEPPIWAIFGDLMAGMVGVFVILIVWFLGFQLELSQSLKEEISKRQAEQQLRIQEETLRKQEELLRKKEQQRRKALEVALADPLASGRVTLRDGKIGISGSVLFALNSDQLQPQGQALLKTLVKPLMFYLGKRNELLMVSGFTDDLPIQKGNNQFSDNWELSAQRALTVTRALIKAGMPSSMVFAAAFGAEQPAVPNQDEQSRARNRRVEMAPVPKSANLSQPVISKN
jgi:flagellar motor protein MotB